MTVIYGITKIDCAARRREQKSSTVNSHLCGRAGSRSLSWKNLAIDVGGNGTVGLGQTLPATPQPGEKQRNTFFSMFAENERLLPSSQPWTVTLPERSTKAQMSLRRRGGAAEAKQPHRVEGEVGVVRSSFRPPAATFSDRSLQLGQLIHSEVDPDLCVTALRPLILEVYYRHLPLFDELGKKSPTHSSKNKL